MHDDQRTKSAFDPEADRRADRPAPAEVPEHDEGLSDYLGLSSLRDADLSGPGFTTSEEPGAPLDMPDEADRH